MTEKANAMMPPMTDKQKAISLARSLWSCGTQQKEIARQTGLSVRTIGRVCSDVHRPAIEHRGRHKRKFSRMLTQAFDTDNQATWGDSGPIPGHHCGDEFDPA